MDRTYHGHSLPHTPEDRKPSAVDGAQPVRVQTGLVTDTNEECSAGSRIRGAHIARKRNRSVEVTQPGTQRRDMLHVSLGRQFIRQPALDHIDFRMTMIILVFSDGAIKTPLPGKAAIVNQGTKRIDRGRSPFGVKH
jgi:hypothetical protein